MVFCKVFLLLLSLLLLLFFFFFCFFFFFGFKSPLHVGMVVVCGDCSRVFGGVGVQHSRVTHMLVLYLI